MNDERLAADAPWTPGQRLIEAVVDGRPLSVKIDARRGHDRLTTRGRAFTVRARPPRVAALARHMIEKTPPDLSRFLVSPMPGLLTRLEVAEGDPVEAGQPLAAVEAMKMENILRAPKAGRVKAVSAASGASLARDEVILEFE